MSDGVILTFPNGKPADPPCEGTDGHGTSPPPFKSHYVFAIVKDKVLHIKLAFPHTADEEGEVYDIPLSKYETQEILMCAARALANG